MGKSDYDDVSTGGYSRDGRDKREKTSAAAIIAVIVVCLVICIGGIVIWARMAPSPENEGSKPAAIEQMEHPVLPAQPVEKIETTEPEVSSPDAGQVQEPGRTPFVRKENVAQALDDVAMSKTVQFMDYTIQEGETINDIADKFSLNPKTLVSVNKIRNIQGLVAGTVIRIPDRDGQIYEVKSGDMLSKLTSKFNLDIGWQELMDLNGLKSENLIVGQQLFIPDNGTAYSPKKSATQSSTDFRKPCSGQITSVYGQSYTDRKTGLISSLDGIIIQNSAGGDVVASAPGNVVDVGVDERGLGRFVVISHEDSYQTVYGSLSNVNVTIGSKVTAGQKIGVMGDDFRNFGKPTLYFAIEQAGIALDPAMFF